MLEGVKIGSKTQLPNIDSALRDQGGPSIHSPIFLGDPRSLPETIWRQMRGSQLRKLHMQMPRRLNQLRSKEKLIAHLDTLKFQAYLMCQKSFAQEATSGASLGSIGVERKIAWVPKVPRIEPGIPLFGSVVAFSGFSGASPPLKSSKICCRADLAPPQGVPRFYEPLLNVSWLWLGMAGLNTTWATQIATFCNKTVMELWLPCCNALPGHWCNSIVRSFR